MTDTTEDDIDLFVRFCITRMSMVPKALFFIILGLQIFFQNIKVGGGKKIKIKIVKQIFLFNMKHIWIRGKK